MKTTVKTSRRTKRRRPQPEHEENIFNPFAPVLSGFRRWRNSRDIESAGSFRNAFITVLLLHVMAILAIMAYGSIKKVAAGPKTTHQSAKTGKGSALEEILSKSPNEVIPTRDAKPGESLVAVRDKDPFLPDSAQSADSKKTKRIERIARVDEPLPPVTPPTSASAEPKPTMQPSAVLGSIEQKEATKRAFLAATGRSPSAEATEPVAAPTEPEIRKPEPAVKQIQELEQAPVQNSTPTPNEYVVGNGDNIYTVSKRLNVSYAELAKANNLSSPRDLRVGQTLVVPQRSNL